MASWLEAIPGFGIDNLPYGSFDPDGRGARLGVRIGSWVLDLRGAAREGLVPECCDAPDLGPVLATDAATWTEVREIVLALLTETRHEPRVRPLLHAVDAVRLAMPFEVGDFVDFYSSEAHATKVGRLFRQDGPALAENWKRLPVAYHGRSGTVRVSGSPVIRPRGQRRKADGSVAFGTTGKLDFEVEMGWVIGGEDPPGAPPGIDEAGRRIFGLVLVNDWSARDIQAWEYVPLGPFLGKSFATSMGPWVVPLAALEPYRTAPPPQDPPPLPYLSSTEPWAIDVDLAVTLSTQGMRASGVEPAQVGQMRFRDMYWTIAQQFAHLVVNGASARPGDLCGSGTISGWGEDEAGCLLERTSDGRRAIVFPDGTSRTYLEDGDEVGITAATPDGGVAFGEVIGRIDPPHG